MRSEAVAQYLAALKLGQKYYQAAVSEGTDPYPAVLDDIVSEADIFGQKKLGMLQIPANRIVGTKTASRAAALAGNFMPLLDQDTEFAAKWISLCDSHLEEGIRDAISVIEYLGKFYVVEGNKRASVLLSFEAPTVPAVVTRYIPVASYDPEVQRYYAFLWFFERSNLYEIELPEPNDYAKFQTLLWHDQEHKWTEEDRRKFLAGLTVFRRSIPQKKGSEIKTNDSLLLRWLELYPFSDISSLPKETVQKRISALLIDDSSDKDTETISISTQPEEKEKTIITKIINAVKDPHPHVGFIFADRPAVSPWAAAHNEGRIALENSLGESVTTASYYCDDGNYDKAIEQAIDDGCDVIFATTVSMINACRRAYAMHPEVRVLNCALFLPYSGVRMYYSRIHEAKYVSGAIAGVVAQNDRIGYVARYPIYGTFASINAFALGVRLTNPRARISLVWSCLPGDPTEALLREGIDVISNREAFSPGCSVSDLDLGTYLIKDGSYVNLATPYWDWGIMYEKIVQSIIDGSWKNQPDTKAINYWWGMDSGAIKIRLSDSLPDGVLTLGKILAKGIADKTISPFQTKIIDQAETMRNDGSRDLSPIELVQMDWLCDNVDGIIPFYEMLTQESRETVRALGIYRDSLLPEDTK